MSLKVNLSICISFLFSILLTAQESVQKNWEQDVKFQSDITVAEKSAKEKEADDLFVKGRQAYTEGKYEEAVKEFFIPAKEILKTISNNPIIPPKIQRIDQAISDSYYFLAEQKAAEAEKAAKSSQYDEAIKLCNEAIIIYPANEQRFRDLIERYVRMKEVVDFRAKTSEEIVDPKKDERLYKIDVLYQQGKKLYEDGQYDKARDKFEEILSINPYHLKSAEQIKIINAKMYDVAKERHKMTITERMAEAEWKYVPPLVPRTYVSAEEVLKEPTVKNQETSTIQKKLNEIIIDKIDFDEVTIQAAIKYLKIRSRERDPEGKGVNIILRMSTGAELTKPTAPAEGNADGGAEPAPTTPATVPTITMLVDNIPLGEAIRYICRGANLKYRIEKYAVVIATQEIPLDDLETRIYALETEAIATVGGETGQTGADTTGSSNAVQEYFRNRGIQFPEGARMVFDGRISRLIATNTPDNLAKIEEIIQEINVVDPQVLIEAKFVEIAEADVDSLGFEWLIQRPSGQTNPPIGEDSFTFDQNDPLMRFSDDLTTTWSGGNDVLLNVTHHDSQGVTYQAILHALNASNKSEVLSTPRVTTMNGQEATIRMTTERYFPESWTEASITDTGTLVYAVPSIPEFGDPVELGVSLTVTPTVDADKYTIGLQMIPTVQTHIGWTDYSYVIPSSVGNITNNIQMPIFELRTIETQMTIYDGETVVMGGAIKDESGVTDDRIPMLGDIPLLGRLFRSKTENRDKRNLLIFVTVRLVNPDGSPLREREVRGLPPFRR
ncbi:MAG TPA: tetratricopeptide repeat protein [Victivallales bacterium]|nr:tetratricopeptide repeat protein [Victivallales bacterium]